MPVVAGAAHAHPLGNFTINHYAGIRVEADRVLLDVVIDQAEIPTFQATMELDLDGDGEFSADELAQAERTWCRSVGAALTLSLDGSPATMRLVEAGISFPPGNGGLSTMRLVCTIEAPFAAPLAGPATIAFDDRFEASRIGWREITVTGSGVRVTGDGLLAASTTNRLLTYPTTLASAPDMRSVSFTATPGGPVIGPLDIPDADPIDPLAIGVTAAASASPPSPGASPWESPAPSARAAAGAPTSDSTGTGAVPGGEGTIPDILRTLPVTPVLALIALATAALLGAGHALTPGHGKTLMAAYLVGTRGTPRHALGLGAAVSVSHTIGILGLAMVVLAAESALPPDLVVRVAPVIAALTIVGIGGWMLITELRRVRARRSLAVAPDHVHDDGHEHIHASTHPHDPAVVAAALEAVDHPHPHPHEHIDDGLEHAHGGIRHRHVPAPGTTITWRSLVILGLAGGLIPSTNALLILLATIAAGQPGWGVVLVVAFGLGMAAVMAGVGLAFVYARGLIERGAARAGVGRVARLVPLGAAIVVLAVGVVLTTQALAAVRVA